MADRKEPYQDPYRAHNFLIEIEGVISGGFQECSGLESETDVILYRIGDDKDNTLKKLPGLKSFSDITLRRGIVDDKSLWDWRKKVMDGKVERKNVSIIVRNEEGEEKIRWNIREAWPRKWTGPDLKADGNAVAVETLTFCHEGFDRA
ncbi:MAG: phage tail protein [bacterium]|jgi:phage tail-like protein